MECQADFEKLKRLFAAEPMLRYPNTDAPFVNQTDASDVAVGAVLLQEKPQGILQPCAYPSKKLSDTEQVGSMGGGGKCSSIGVTDVMALRRG